MMFVPSLWVFPPCARSRHRASWVLEAGLHGLPPQPVTARVECPARGRARRRNAALAEHRAAQVASSHSRSSRRIAVARCARLGGMFYLGGRLEGELCVEYLPCQLF